MINLLHCICRRVLGDYIENIHNYDALREKIDTLSE